MESPSQPTQLDYANPRTTRRPINGVAAFSALAGTVACFLCAMAFSTRSGRDLILLAIPFSLTALVFGGGACLAFRTSISAGRPRGTWLGFLGIVLSGAPLSLMLLPSLSSGPTSNRAKCASNLRQLGQAAKLYADENGGHCPDDIAGFLTQDIVTGVFVCPTTNDTPAAEGPTTRATAANVEAGGHLSYVYLGKDWMADELTPTVVLAYEPLKNHGNQGMSVLFGDGHVEFLVTSEAMALLAELNAGHNPPRAGTLK